MLIKFIPLIAFVILLSCSKDEKVNFSDSINIFQPKNTISFVNKKDRKNSQLSNLIDLKEILNSKTYNLNNSKVNYPFKKKWQINTEQTIDDSNPYLPDPLYFSKKIYLLTTNGYLFKINPDNGKVIWKKQIFKDLEFKISCKLLKFSSLEFSLSSLFTNEI